MNRAEFRRWLNDTLAEIEPLIGEPPAPKFAELVAVAKAHAYALGLHEFALSLPDDAECKSPLTAANQLRRCLRATESDTEGASGALTARQVADRLGVAPETVIEWINTGQLKGSNVGKGQQRGRYRVTEADLAEFLASRQPEPPAKRSRPIQTAFRRYS